MQFKSVAIGSDHAGFALKEKVKNHLVKIGMSVKDVGTFSDDSVDYPDFAVAVARHVKDGQSECGIVICGSGIGVSISANKVAGIRAALCYTPELAGLARQHNNANVLAMGGRFTEPETAYSIVDAFLNTEFEGGRHIKRVEKIHSLTDC